MSAKMPSLNLPTNDVPEELIPGGVKKVKTENRRSDALFFIPPSKIKVMPDFNVRIHDESYQQHVRSLADSMKATGFNPAHPLSVYVARDGEDDVLCLINGHSRLEAAKIAMSEGADFADIPVVILPKTVSMLDMTVELFRGNAGRPLSPLEMAAVVARLEKMEISEAEIAQRLQLTASYVNSLILLAAAPRAIKAMVAKEELSATFAIAQIRKHGSKVVEVLTAAKKATEVNGKAKITASVLPGARQAKALRTSAPKLWEAARAVKADPAYSQLSPELRDKLDAVLSSIPADAETGDVETPAVA